MCSFMDHLYFSDRDKLIFRRDIIARDPPIQLVELHLRRVPGFCELSRNVHTIFVGVDDDSANGISTLIARIGQSYVTTNESSSAVRTA